MTPNLAFSRLDIGFTAISPLLFFGVCKGLVLFGSDEVLGKRGLEGVEVAYRGFKEGNRKDEVEEEWTVEEREKLGFEEVEDEEVKIEEAESKVGEEGDEETKRKLGEVTREGLKVNPSKEFEEEIMLKEEVI